MMPTKRITTNITWVLGLLLLVVGSPLAAAAQQAVPAPTSSPVMLDSARQVAREDTAYAVQRLFHEKRRRYLLQTGVRGAAAGLASTYTALVTLRQPDQTMQKGINVTLSAVFVGLFAHSALKLYQYRARREKKLLATWAAGGRLPVWVRRELRPTYFDTQLSSQ